MTVDPAVIPGLLLLAAELTALASVGFVVVRVALRQTDDRMALAQGLVIGPALWGLIVNFVLYAVPGLAGAAVGWGVTLTLGAVLAWRAPDRIRPRPRVVAGIVVAALALFWVALASRQLLTIPDVANHLGLAASIRAGAFPPVIPWNPSVPTSYHYGIDLLVGLLAPPIGPDLAFVTELLGAYAWVCFVLVVATMLLKRGSWFVAVVLTPLLVTAGAWTLSGSLSAVQIPLPAGLPAAGIRASMADIYWPSASWPLTSYQLAIPDIWKPVFPMAYALTIVVLGRLARVKGLSWQAALTLAGVVGFLGLLSPSLAPIVLLVWAFLEAWRLAECRRVGTAARGALLRSGTGLALAVLLLGIGSGTLTAMLTGAEASGLWLGWRDDPGRWRPLGSFDPLPGGVGLLRVGPVAIAGVAALLARRDRVVLALAAGAGALAFGVVVVHYDPAPWDVARLSGHARNFALLALLLALGVRLAECRPRWRYAASALLVALVMWPTVAAPVRNVALGIERGIEVANATSVPLSSDAPDEPPFVGRFRMPRLPARMAAHIQNHLPVDARVLSPRERDATHATLATGRPSAAGFIGHIHLFPFDGPEHRDAIRHLEPAAIRRLGFDYVYATDAWVADLPDRAVRWLADPDLFELLIRDGSEALYRVRPAFLELAATPAPASYEALRQAVPASATVYLPRVFGSVEALRVAATLSHAGLLGTVDPALLHLRTPWPTEPLGERKPDLVIMPGQVVPWMFPLAGRQPIWWNEAVAIYAPDGAVAPIMSPPPEPEPFPVGVRLSDPEIQNGRFTFTATFDDRAPERWTGQEWVLVAGDASPWAIPVQYRTGRPTPESAIWFAGQAAPGLGTTTHQYEFDAQVPSLAVRDDSGAVMKVVSSTGEMGPGGWTLAVRLQHQWKPQHWREAAFIPVLQIEVSEAGEVSYRVYQDVLGV